MTSKEQLNQLLDIAIKKDASDLHISSGRPPILRLNKKLSAIAGYPNFTPEQIQGFVGCLLSEDQKKRLVRERDIDVAYSFNDKARFRVAVYYELSILSIVMRLIPAKIKTIDELNLPPIVREFAKPSQGFVLVVGPTGHGKSTVLASLIDSINHTRQDHIVTIEDPIEYVFKQDKCIIDQRQVGIDTRSFKHGLRAVFRADADVIMIGEMRDAPTIAIAVTAAETGHLVFSTLHTNTAAQTIDRIIDSFPGEQQPQIRAQLASNLFGIISRRLIPTLDNDITSAVEVLVVDSAVRNLIREGKTAQIDLAIQTGRDIGMISLNQSLLGLMSKGEINQDTAEIFSPNVNELRTLIKGTFRTK